MAPTATGAPVDPFPSVTPSSRQDPFVRLQMHRRAMAKVVADHAKVVSEAERLAQVAAIVAANVKANGDRGAAADDLSSVEEIERLARDIRQRMSGTK